jgi:hypothetical protein
MSIPLGGDKDMAGVDMALDIDTEDTEDIEVVDMVGMAVEDMVVEGVMAVEDTNQFLYDCDTIRRN